MFIPECDAGVDAYRFDKARTIGAPVFRPTGRSRLDQLNGVFDIVGLAQDGFQFGLVETMPGDHHVDEIDDFFPLAEIGELADVFRIERDCAYLGCLF